MWFQFSDSELARRRHELLGLAEKEGLVGVLCFGENRSGIPITYLTEWPVTRQAVCAVTPTECHLWVSFPNHVPNATRRARVDSVRHITASTPEDALALFGPATAIGTLGPLPPVFGHAARERGITLTSLDRQHAELRQIKSAEEITALARGAEATDAGARALIEACAVGATDWDLLAAAKQAYTKQGALDHICYICISDMANPDRDVPSQFPEGRAITATSIITFEISASVAPEYPGQVLRSIVMSDPIDDVVRLSDIAEDCKRTIKEAMRPGVTAPELIQLSASIEEAGYSTTDDLFHGFGMGYLEPVATSSSRFPQHTPTTVIREGRAIVVQPNVVRSDHTLGVQTGELVVVESHGVRDLHSLPTGLIRR